MTTTTRIVRIGNSQGIRLPKVLLEAAGLPEDVTVHAEPGRLVISAAQGTRAGWAEAAQAMHARGEDQPRGAATATRFDRSEWTW